MESVLQNKRVTLIFTEFKDDLELLTKISTSAETFRQSFYFRV